MLYPIREEGAVKGRQPRDEDEDADEVLIRKQKNKAPEGETVGQGTVGPSEIETPYVGEGSSNLGHILNPNLHLSSNGRNFDPVRGKTKSNGYIMFLHSVKRERGEEGMNTAELIREFDHLWKDLSEDERGHWREMAKRRNAGQNHKKTADIAYVSIVQPRQKSSRNDEGDVGTEDQQEEEKKIKIEKTKVEEEDDWGLDLGPVEPDTFNWKPQQEKNSKPQEDEDRGSGSRVPISKFDWSAGL